jgi:hypothetical protein
MPTVLRDNPDKPGHGTCTIGKIIGKTIGLARQAEVVATSIKVDERMNESFLDGLVQIYNAIIARGTGKGGTASAVVNISSSGKLADPNSVVTSLQNSWTAEMIDNFGMLPNRFHRRSKLQTNSLSQR